MKPRNNQEQIHWNHNIGFITKLTKPRTSRNTSTPKMRIHCLQCNVYVRWPSKDEIAHYKKHLGITWKLVEWNNHFDKFGHKSANYTPVSTESKLVIWLDVLYKDKDLVKKYNAKWNDIKKSWYTYSDNNKLEHLLPWMNKCELEKLHEFLSRQYNYKPYT